MSESDKHILVCETVLSYPSSLEVQAVNMLKLLQETRIRKYGKWQNQRLCQCNVKSRAECCSV